MRRRDRQSEMVVALIVAIAMVFALIFAIVLSLGNEGDETAEATPSPDSGSTLDITLETTAESDSTEESASTPTRVIITSAATESLQVTEVAVATETMSEATVTITEESLAPTSPTLTATSVDNTEAAIVITNTPTPSASPTEAALASATPRPTRTRVNWQDLQTQVAQQAASNQPPASPTSTASNTPTATLTSSATPSFTWTLTATPSPTATLTWTASRTPSLTATPSRTASPSLTPSATPTLTTVALVQTQAPSRTAIPLAFLRTQAAAGTVTQVAAFASPTPIPCIPRSDWDIYVIDVGDTFYSIARRYNLSMEALAAANCIPNLSLIYAGQPLRVPPGGDRAVQGPDAGVEFCNTSDAVLTAPSPGTGLTGMVILRGVAQGTNFRRYILDWRPDDPAVDYQSFAEVFTAVTAEGELGQFNSDAFSPGLYWFRLRVLETNDFIIGQCAIRVRFR